MNATKHVRGSTAVSWNSCTAKKSRNLPRRIWRQSQWQQKPETPAPDRIPSAPKKPLNLLEDVQEHRFGQPSRLRVLLAGMVGREEMRKPRGEFGHGAMRERVCRPVCNPAASLQNVEITVPGNLAEREDRARSEQLEFALKVRTAA